MYPATATKPKYSPELIFGALGALALLIALIWYFAKQDAAVRVLQDDTKELKGNAAAATKFTAETGFRLNSLEQRATGVEQRLSTVEQRPVAAPAAKPAPSASRP
jgi:hypothetical protein